MFNIWDSLLCILTIFGLLKHSSTAFKWVIGMMFLDILIIGIQFCTFHMFGTHPNSFLMRNFEELSENPKFSFFLNLIHERSNIFLKDVIPYPNSMIGMFLNGCIWLHIASWIPSHAKKGPKKAKNSKKSEDSAALQVEPSWFFHSCLYGHKDNLKRILDKSEKVDINPNLTTIDGETPLHLAIIGNHLPIGQISHQQLFAFKTGR